MTDARTYSVLAMAGVTPFLACALLPLNYLGVRTAATSLAALSLLIIILG